LDTKCDKRADKTLNLTHTFARVTLRIQISGKTKCDIRRFSRNVSIYINFSVNNKSVSNLAAGPVPWG